MRHKPHTKSASMRSVRGAAQRRFGRGGTVRVRIVVCPAWATQTHHDRADEKNESDDPRRGLVEAIVAYLC